MDKEKIVPKLGLAALAGAAALAGYVSVIRPWHLRWGATGEESRESLPGDEILSTPDHEATHALTIDAPIADVWPWLVQLGQNRGGFYSYSWLENLVGCNIQNANRIVPEWQSLRVGDVIWLHPKAPPLPVKIVEPYRAIVLGDVVEEELEDGSTVTGGGTWGIYLKEIDAETTRLIIRIRWARVPGVGSWLSNYVVLEPAHFIMERKMMLNIKRRAEGLAMSRAASA